MSDFANWLNTLKENEKLKEENEKLKKEKRDIVDFYQALLKEKENEND